MGKMKKATYQDENGKDFTVEYDPDDPCLYCGYPVEEASMGGTLVCPSCDMGVNRFTGRPWSLEEYFLVHKNFKLATTGGKTTPAFGRPERK